MRETALSVPVKAWAVACAILGVSLTANTLLTCLLALLAFCQLVFERRWRLFLAFGAFYLVLALLLYLIRFHGLHMVVFSEFYVLMFYNLMPVFLAAWISLPRRPGQLSAALSKAHTPTPAILGLLVVFRFFPTMKAELKGVRQSMKNRRLTGPVQVLRHPARHLRVCVGSLAAALPANRGPAFCIGHSAGRPGAGLAGKLLCQKEAAG